MFRIKFGLWVAWLGLNSCTIPLDPQGGALQVETSPSVVSGCKLFENALFTPGVGHSVALLTSATLPSGAFLWTFDGASAAGGRADGLAVMLTGTTPGCPGDFSPVVTALPATATDSDFVTLLDVVVVGSDAWQFYETWHFASGAAFGIKTVGRSLAKYDEIKGYFVRSANLLWTADRPAYGQSALVDGNWLYAYGCASANSGFSRECYAARIALDKIADSEAWQYAVAVNKFSNNVDDAQPILFDVGDLSLQRHASGRLLATYIKPLDNVMQIRSALGPTGPFSAAHPLGQCPTTPGNFCVGAVQHMELDKDANTIALTFALSSFEKLADDVKWPRLVQLALPDALP